MRYDWWAEYECGCVSLTARTKSGLSNHCKQHAKRVKTFWRADYGSVTAGREELSAVEIGARP